MTHDSPDRPIEDRQHRKIPRNRGYGVIVPKVQLDRVRQRAEGDQERAPIQVAMDRQRRAVASCEALRERGLDERSARSRVAAIHWGIYQRFTRLPWALTRLCSRDRLRRVKRAMDWFMRFPYASPGDEMRWVRDEANVVGFDVQRCPAAEYFGARRLNELCTDAFCDLDDPLAEIWGVRRERPSTLAKGCDHCDFRFHQGGS